MIRRIQNSKAAQNFGWLVADRGIRLLVGVVVGSWVARYLGKQEFGLLNYSIALVAIFAALTPLGMDALVVREIIQDPKKGGRWIGTTLGFRAIAAIMAMAFGFGMVTSLRPHEPRAWGLVVVLGIGTLFQALESGELWFQAHMQMRRLVGPRVVLFLLVSTLKVAAVLRGAGVLWFCVLTAFEQVTSGVVTLILVKRSLGRGNPIVLEITRGLGVLRESWPLAVSALSVIIYIKVAQLILSGLLGDAALGVYAAAIRLPEAASFIPMVLASSLLPSLMRSRGEGPEAYRNARMRFFRLNVFAALLICLPVSLCAPMIIRLLFGSTYAEAGPVLAVYVWTLLFIFVGVARGQHLLNERQTQFPLWYSLLGLVVNILCCWALIPTYGPMGAALASVASQVVAAFLSSFVHPKTRDVGREQWLAMLTPWRFWMTT
jgi:PST family polysaccharide transporter